MEKIFEDFFGGEMEWAEIERFSFCGIEEEVDGWTCGKGLGSIDGRRGFLRDSVGRQQKTAFDIHWYLYYITYADKFHRFILARWDG